MAEGLSLGLDFTVDADGFIAAPDGEDFGLAVEADDSLSRVRDVELPSGNLTRLECPSLACLLWAGDSSLKLAKAIWRHPQGNLELFKDLDDSDIDYIYEWGLVEFAKLQDSLNLGSLCKLFHRLPSEYLGITDRMTGYLFDITMAGTLGEEESRQMKAMEKNSKRGTTGDLPPDPQDTL